MIFNVFLKLN